MTLDNLAIHFLCHFFFPMYFLDYKHLNIHKIAWLSRILMFTIFLFIKSSIKMIVITLTTLMSLVDLALSPSLNWMTSAASMRTSDIILILILLCQPHHPHHHHHPHHPPSFRYLLHQHLHPLLVRFTFKVKWLPFGRMHAARTSLSCPDLEFVKKFTGPNFRVKEFYTLKTRKSRLFSPALNSEKASLSVIWPSFG